MSRKVGPHELDLTASGELVSAMSVAVGRLRQLAAAAFDAGREKTTPPAPPQPSEQTPRALVGAPRRAR